MEWIYDRFYLFFMNRVSLKIVHNLRKIVKCKDVTVANYGFRKHYSSKRSFLSREKKLIFRTKYLQTYISAKKHYPSSTQTRFSSDWLRLIFLLYVAHSKECKMVNDV